MFDLKLVHGLKKNIRCRCPILLVNCYKTRADIPRNEYEIKKIVRILLLLFDFMLIVMSE